MKISKRRKGSSRLHGARAQTPCPNRGQGRSPLEVRELALESAGPSPCILHTTRSPRGPTPRFRRGTSRSSPKRPARAVRCLPSFAQWRRQRSSRAGTSLEANSCGGPIRTSLSGRLSRRRNPSYYPAENARFRLRTKHETLRTQHSRASRKPRTREREGRPGRPGKTFWMDKVGIEKPSTSGVRVTRPKRNTQRRLLFFPMDHLSSRRRSGALRDGPFQLARSGASWPLSATYSEYPPP